MASRARLVFDIGADEGKGRGAGIKDCGDPRESLIVVTTQITVGLVPTLTSSLNKRYTWGFLPNFKRNRTAQGIFRKLSTAN